MGGHTVLSLSRLSAAVHGDPSRTFKIGLWMKMVLQPCVHERGTGAHASGLLVYTEKQNVWKMLYRGGGQQLESHSDHLLCAVHRIER